MVHEIKLNNAAGFASSSSLYDFIVEEDRNEEELLFLGDLLTRYNRGRDVF